MKRHLPVVAVALLALVLGAVVGALRLLAIHGYLVGAPLAVLYVHHGELMVLGFLAPLIMVERYVGARSLPLHPVRHAMPVLAAAGALSKLAAWWLGLPWLNALGTVAAVGAALLFAWLLLALRAYSTAAAAFHLMALGALVLALAALLSQFFSPVMNLGLTLLLLWFPVLTILGERVELTRITSPHLARWAGLGIWLGGLSALCLALYVVAGRQRGWLLAGVVALAPVAALLFYGDRRHWREGSGPLGRYLARHLLLAYLWLLLGLGLAAAFAVLPAPSHSLFDAASHAVAVGFVLTMIFGHAPVIFPALSGRRFADGQVSLAPLALLTAGNVLRVGGYLLREAGIYLPLVVGWSGVVLLAAVVLMAGAMVRGTRV